MSSSTYVPHRVSCGQCGDTGKMLAVRNDTNTAPYAFRCTCQRGHHTQVNFPRWSLMDYGNRFDPLYGVQQSDGSATVVNLK